MNLDSFADAVAAELESYSEEVDAVMQDEIDRMTDEVVEDLKTDPDIPEKTGDYKKGFYKKKLAKGRGYNRNVVANKKYQLTHLLEYGHATQTGGMTRAYPHWSKAQKKVETLDERVAKRLNGTG